MSTSLVRTTLAALLALSFVMPMASLAQTEKQPVRHIVVFKYKPDASEDQIKQVTQAFRDLKNRIPGIIAFEDGVNNSPEKKNLGFTHVYVLTFENVAARDAYLPHPEHKKFGQLLGKLGVVADAFVVDYIPAS